MMPNRMLWQEPRAYERTCRLLVTCRLVVFVLFQNTLTPRDLRTKRKMW